MASSKPDVLIVEDDAIIAMDMAQMVEDLGCDIVGPVGTVSRALDMVAENSLDGAILDINLGKERVWPIAHALQEKKIPFVLASGYSRVEVERAFQKAPIITKPVMSFDLKRALKEIGTLQ